MILLAFGSHYEKDNLAWEIAKSLTGVKVELCSRPEDIIDVDDDIYIIDVVKGLTSVRLLDLDDIKTKKSLTTHDFDVGFFLKLMEGIGKVRNIKIIGIPEKKDKKKIKAEVENLLKSCDI